jgi:hypothetical protein
VRCGHADFRASRSHKIWAALFQLRHELSDEIIAAGQRAVSFDVLSLCCTSGGKSTQIAWVKRRHVLVGVFGGNTGEPMFTSNDTVDWDKVVLLIPTMHDCHFITNIVLQQLLIAIKTVETDLEVPQEQRVSSKLSRLINDADFLQGKGMLNASFTKVRLFISTYVCCSRLFVYC